MRGRKGRHIIKSFFTSRTKIMACHVSKFWLGFKKRRDIADRCLARLGADELNDNVLNVKASENWA